MSADHFYAFMLIGGPILLGVVLLWAMTHNRLSRRQKQESEAATRRLYKEQGEEDRRRDSANRS